MNNSTYQSRAKAINGTKFVDQTVTAEISPEEFWNTRVQKKEDIITFYKTYYPCLPEILVLALADYFHRQIKGEVPLSEQFYRNSETNKRLTEKVWDFESEVRELKEKALIQKSCEKLEQLLIEELKEEQQQDKKTKKKQKKNRKN